MNQKTSTKDRNGKTVLEGDKVQVMCIGEDVMSRLADKQEIADVKSMIYGVFEVEEIDEHGSAWVTKWFDIDNDNKHSHSIGLAPNELELANV